MTIDGHTIGRLEGFRFTVSPDARATDKRLLLATAEKRLAAERVRLAGLIVAAGDDAFALQNDAIVWGGHAVARLGPGPSLARPKAILDPALDCLDPPVRDAVAKRLRGWIEAVIAHALPAISAVAILARDPSATSPLRSVAGAIEAGAGFVARLDIRQAVEALCADDRRRLRNAGVTIGALDVFDPRLLKPRAAVWRQALLATKTGTVPLAPPEGATTLARGTPGAIPAMGFRPLGAQAVRIDLVERIARAAHDARPTTGGARKPFAPDPALAISMGLQPETIARLMAELGFRPAPAADGVARWVWRGRAPAKRVAPLRDNAFAALADLYG